jgi:hypothetical protein
VRASRLESKGPVKCGQVTGPFLNVWLESWADSDLDRVIAALNAYDEDAAGQRDKMRDILRAYLIVLVDRRSVLETVLDPEWLDYMTMHTADALEII